MSIHVFAMVSGSCDVAFKLKAIGTEGGIKQADRCSPAQDRHKASTRVVFGSQYQLLANVGC